MASKHYYCNISFPNSGRWTIYAKYRSSTIGPAKYVASSSFVITIKNPIAITTSPQPQDTETVLGPGSSFYQLESSGEYSVTMAALVSVDQFFSPQLLSPGGGSVDFVDSSGTQICTVTLPLRRTATLLTCTSGGFVAPPSNPITGHYSGTKSGVDDGHGSTYSSSDGSLTIGSY